jgi:hypothetical protein
MTTLNQSVAYGSSKTSFKLLNLGVVFQDKHGQVGPVNGVRVWDPRKIIISIHENQSHLQYLNQAKGSPTKSSRTNTKRDR